MRILLLLMLTLPVAGCAAGPTALGITGPGQAQARPAQANSDTAIMDPDLNGSRYAPSLVPTTNGGHYWGYNN